MAGLFNSVSCVSSDRILVVFDNNIGTRNSEEAQLEIFTKSNVFFLLFIFQSREILFQVHMDLIVIPVRTDILSLST